jgi:hypothetical protein
MLSKVFSVVIFLLLVVLFIQGSDSNTSRTTPPKQRRSSAGSQEIRELRQALAAQQQQIRRQQIILEQQQLTLQQLQQQLLQRDAASRSAEEAVQQLNTKATVALEKASSVETQQAGSSANLQQDVAQVRANLTTTAETAKEQQSKISELQNVLGRFQVSGDIRLRGDSIVQNYDGCVACDPRNQERIRLRLGIEGKLNEDFNGGIYIASGALTNPISSNETLTNFFERKTVGFDRGWITYQPQAHPWLQLTGGKFGYTWLRTSLTFDPDLNPEGGSEKLSFDINNPVVKNISLTGIELLFNEIPKRTTVSTATALTGATALPSPILVSANDGFAVGGQISTKLRLSHAVTVTPAVTALNWRNTDTIAQSISALTSPAGNALTNATVNETVIVNGKSVSVPVGYRSKFLYTDAILDTTIKTPWTRFPFHMVLDYEQNIRAASGSRHGYWAEATLGDTKEKGDVQFGHAFGRIEQDAVIAAFNESELRAGTNVVQNRVLFAYQLQRNVTAQFTGWFGRTLDSNLQNALLAPGLKPGTKDAYQKRFQLDLLYKF